MKITDRKPGRVLEGFLNRIQTEVYSEPDSEMHMALIDRMLPGFTQYIPDRGTRLLDVGCGQGYASLMFKKLGYHQLSAITLSDEDVEAAIGKGIECYKMDMSFLGFEDKIFDALWVRHALEHSPFPYLTLLEFNRVLTPGGHVYIEMPMPDTPRVLENWPNHYSIFGEQMWTSLFDRSGFTTIVQTSLRFTMQDDGINDGKPFQQSNHVFVLQKGRDEAIN